MVKDVKSVFIKQKLLSDWLTLKPAETTDGSNTSCDGTNGEPHSLQPLQMSSTTTCTDENETGQMRNDIDVDSLDFEAEQMSDAQECEQQGDDPEHDDIELEQDVDKGHGDDVDETVSTCTIDTDQQEVLKTFELFNVRQKNDKSRKYVRCAL